MNRPRNHRARTIPAVAWAALTLLGLSCQKQEPSPTAQPIGRGANTDNKNVAKPGNEGDGSASRPTVTLIDPGAEPRRKLRYLLPAGASQYVDITLAMTMTLQAQGLPGTPMVLPTMKMAMKIAIDEERPTSSDQVEATQAGYRFELVGADAVEASGGAPGTAQMIKAEIAKLVGVKGRAIVDDRGFHKDVDIELPVGLPPQMAQAMTMTRQSLEQMSAPLPEEPVGVGAKWKLVQHTEQNGIKIEQVTVFTMSRLDGNRGTWQTTIEQNAKPQQATIQNVTAEIKSLHSVGSGEIEFDLSVFMPTSFKAEAKTDTEMSAAGQNIKMHADTHVTISTQSQAATTQGATRMRGPAGAHNAP